MDAPTDPIINRGELQRLLGKHSDTIRRWLKDGVLPKPDIAPTRQGIAWRASTLRRAGFDLLPERPANPPSGTASAS